MTRLFLQKYALVLLAGFITAFIIDPLDPSTVSTPFCLSIILMGLSLRQSVSLVIAGCITYAFLVVYSLVTFQEYYSAHVHVPVHPAFWLFQREGLFLVVCGICIHLAYYRRDTQQMLTQLRRTLRKLPTPIILSDASGEIVYANDSAIALLDRPSSEIVDESYFNLFLMEKVKGESIRTYFDLFESNQDTMRDLEVSLLGHEKGMSAQIICLGRGPNRVMITVLLSGEKIPGGLGRPPDEDSLAGNIGSARRL